MRVILYMCIFAPMIAGHSLFSCSSPCYLPHSDEYTTVYMKTPTNSTSHVHIVEAPAEIHIELSFPQMYPISMYSTSLAVNTNATFHCVAHLQISKYTIVSAVYSTVNGSFHVSLHANANDIIWSIAIGQSDSPSPREVLLAPYLMAKTHGSAWAQQYYYYIYIVFTLGIATMYITYYHPRMWKTCIAVSMAFFAATACDKIYHVVHAGCVQTSERMYMACVVIFLADIVPLMYCVIMVSKGQLRPIVWGSMGMLGALGLVFVHGAGWFVGPGVLALGSISLILLRVFERWPPCYA